jgi:YihY family inner membrane protein
MNTMWAVPRHRRPNPLQSRLRSLLLLGTVGAAALATTGLSAAASSARPLGLAVVLAATVLSVALNAAVFGAAFRIATARRLDLGEVVPGALVAAVIWHLLQLFGAAYAGRVLDTASATYGAFALVLGLLAWLYLAATGIVLAVEVNVVRAKHLYPRALLTPFTDDVDLTGADQRTYTEAAVAQRAKGFESVDVSFDHDGQNATRLRRRRAGR